MPLPYTLTAPIGSRARLGLIVLQSDETIEPDLQLLFPERDIALYTGRVPSGADVTPETLAAMAEALPAAARLLPPSISFDAVGYACTSGATVIGPERVAALISGAANAPRVTNPLTAAIAAMRALEVGRIGFISPYIEEVSAAMRARFEAAGIMIAAFDGYGIATEAVVARIDPESTKAAALDMGRRPEIEALFLSCTNLRTLEIIDAVEAELGKPVVSSNLALAWHMAQLAGLGARPGLPGRLMRLAAEESRAPIRLPPGSPPIAAP
ncbi:maleate cis-trans isomerase family protein [Acidimangrovimonas pyrenivorans]|uniref:Asp/Glu racemase n=1 Tax=Acidimangrovimonas pyrenivorans TaxID=2030798 RepID=A0ABV7AEV2_9RHOB